MANKIPIVVLLIVFISLFSLLLIKASNDSNPIGKLKCRVDSVEAFHPNSNLPDLEYKNYTNCGYIFYTKNEHKVGDTLYIKCEVNNEK